MERVIKKAIEELQGNDIAQVIRKHNEKHEEKKQEKSKTVKIEVLYDPMKTWRSQVKRAVYRSENGTFRSFVLVSALRPGKGAERQV